MSRLFWEELLEAALLIPATDFKNTPAFASLAPPSEPQTNGSAHAPADDAAAAEDDEIKIEGVDIWVTSEYSTLLAILRSEASTNQLPASSSSSPLPSPPASHSPTPQSPSTPSSAPQNHPSFSSSSRALARNSMTMTPRAQSP
ncbi:MAG: hypothetical protein Q9207_006799 [Kuettlingeria erythrocarpa]